MRSRPNPLLGLINRDYFETFDLYSPRKTDFHDRVAAELPADWRLQRNGIWFHCGSPLNIVPEQGWKIHVSATADDALETLNRVVKVLFQRRDTDFKFALDSYVLSLLNGKNWPRGCSGKFITVYPKDNGCFVELIEELHQVTLGQRGPYILSDHQYEKNSVVFYRYGGMRARLALNIAGEKVPLLTGPDGRDVPDQRLPFPNTPDWVESPILTSRGEDDAAHSTTLHNGRYEIVDVLAFSNAGGVYRALDRQTGNPVVVKEARQHISSAGSGDCDAVGLLHKEYRLLQLLADTGIAAQPRDFFQEWEHWFLVEEFIDGIPLASHIAERSLLLRTRPSQKDFDLWHEELRSLIYNLANLIETLHERGIVFGDLSPNNLLLTKTSNQIRLIDFEGARQLGVDLSVNLHTPGFASPNQKSGGTTTFQDDYYAAGAVICSCLFPLNGLLDLCPEGAANLMHNIGNDSRIPQAVTGMILDLLSSDPAQRPSPAQMRAIVSSSSACERSCRHHEMPVDYRAVIDDIHRHVLASATYSRKDRLFPSDPRLFSTNPLSLAYGAAGIAYALHRISNEVPEKAIEWILQHEVDNREYPPGLYVGSSGIAWCLLEMGLKREAERIFRHTLAHPLRCQSADLFYGLAGWGMTSLRFFLETQDEVYLFYARQAAAGILETSARDHQGRFWTHKGEVRLGIAQGASGIALFLLYLYLATGNSEYLSAGHEALEFDLGHAVETKDSGLAWSHSSNSPSPLYPYWHFGSAGVGRVALRFYRLLQDERLQSLLEKIFVETDRKYAVFPNQFMGLAGLGEFSLDMFDLSGDARFLLGAQKAASGIMLFRVERDGIAFPGDQLARLSCDYGTGSAGIAVFLNRLIGRQNDNFMLDALFHVQHAGGEKYLDSELIAC
jgi:serine/threonine protein kinase